MRSYTLFVVFCVVLTNPQDAAAQTPRPPGWSPTPPGAVTPVPAMVFNSYALPAPVFDDEAAPSVAALPTKIEAVNLPADAVVTMNGDSTRSTGTHRVYTSMEQTGYYDVVAKVTRGGMVYSLTHKVHMAPGQTVQLNFDALQTAGGGAAYHASPFAVSSGDCSSGY